jgi:predicted regulator of Ras-like GTPase activity (Roadblock/LC7/MglB family)
MTYDAASTEMSLEATEFGWMLRRFATETAGVTEAIAVSADGLPIAMSSIGDDADFERLAAIVSGMVSLAAAAGGSFHLGTLTKVIVDMSDGFLLLSAISEGSVLGVIVSNDANLGDVAYEMILFANRARAVLTPRLVNELKNSVL